VKPPKGNAMRPRASDPANPLHTDDMPWIPTAAGKSFRPLRFDPGGWSELMRLEPGSLVALHRHPGEVHAFNMSGTRQILGTGEIIGPGDYVYEPPGTVDAWQAIGEEPCIVHIKVTGAVEYLDDAGQVIEVADSASQCAAYLAWCREHGADPVPQILNRGPQHQS
jgi:2,4'-dihydroxyacetophenone dioxygenase